MKANKLFKELIKNQEEINRKQEENYNQLKDNMYKLTSYLIFLGNKDENGNPGFNNPAEALRNLNEESDHMDHLSEEEFRSWITKELNDLKEKCGSLESDVADMKKKISTSSKEVKGMVKTVAKNKRSIDKLDWDVKDIRGDITELSGRVEKWRTKIDGKVKNIRITLCSISSLVGMKIPSGSLKDVSRSWEKKAKKEKKMYKRSLNNHCGKNYLPQDMIVHTADYVEVKDNERK